MVSLGTLAQDTAITWNVDGIGASSWYVKAPSSHSPRHHEHSPPHHFCAILGDATIFILAPNHNASDVLQEDERNSALVTQLHKVSALLRTIAKQDAIVGDDANGIAKKACKTRDEGGTVERFELIQARAVDYASNDRTNVKSLWGG